jgi:2-dehydropantoate 2-reductase
MREIVVVGAGGIGGTVAALLARTGRCAVKVLGRPGAHIEAVARNGLRLSGLEEFTAQVTALDNPADVESCDILVLAVKAQQTASVLASTQHIAVRELAVSLQNGTAKDDALVDAFGEQIVMGAVAIVAGELPGPGEVRWTYDGMTLVGELDGSRSTRADGFAQLLVGAGLNAASTESIVSATWTKTVGWVPIGLFATLTRLTNAETLSNVAIASEYVRLLHELAALAAAQDVELQDFGPFHVRTWTNAPCEQAIELVRRSPLASSGSTHSALQDIQRGQPTELSGIIGPMLADGKRLGVPLPGVRALYAALMGLEETL